MVVENDPAMPAVLSRLLVDEGREEEQGGCLDLK
jgi:hypothetical protein